MWDFMVGLVMKRILAGKYHLLCMRKPGVHLRAPGVQECSEFDHKGGLI